MSKLKELTWENHSKAVENIESHRKTIGKPLENNSKTKGSPYENYCRTIPKATENHRNAL